MRYAGRTSLRESGFIPSSGRNPRNSGDLPGFRCSQEHRNRALSAPIR
ncbi:hypothetical protein ACFPRL_05785 [Pseudoclavibacter helvolus]